VLLDHAQIGGFHVHHTFSASFRNSPTTISGAGPNASGMARDNSSSRSTLYFENPPIIGDEMAKTTRPTDVSRIGKEHITQGRASFTHRRGRGARRGV
jgi:hypothetical protein